MAYLTFANDTFRAHVSKAGRSEYIWLYPEYIDQWKKDGFKIQKVSKLIPKGQYSESELEKKYYINGGLIKKDADNKKKVNQFLVNWNKKNNTNFKSMQELIRHKEAQKRKVRNENAERKRKQQETLKLYKESKLSILKTDVMRKILSGQMDVPTDEKTKTDMEKEIKKDVILRKKRIGLMIDNLADMPFRLRQNKTFQKQIEKDINTIMELIETA